MEKRLYPNLGEEVFWDVLPNGLPLAVVSRRGFTKKLAYFATNFGSVHTQFQLDGQWVQTPTGVAHFLEHKLFDMPGRDISSEFAALGATPNAFTSYDMTAYYFSCTEQFEQSLRLLLEFVSTPYFTQETVEKEQGIIGQEIDMNEDNPDTKIFEQLMQAMYEVHPVREPILGNRSSIGKLTPEILSQCHRAFYNPGNMLLCVVGDVDPQQVRDIALQSLPVNPGGQEGVQRRWQEDMHCKTHLVETSMEVSMPMFQLGFKCEPWEPGDTVIQQEVIGELAAEALFGESSRLYLQLYESGLIDSSFGGGFETLEGMSLLTASGDSDHPYEVQQAILEEAKRIAEQGIPAEDFLRMKRSALGRRIKSLDGFDSTCFRVCAYYFSGVDYFQFPAAYRAVEVSQIQEFLQRVVTEDRMCLSVIYPKEQEVDK